MCSVRMMTAATVGGALTFGMALALLGLVVIEMALRLWFRRRVEAPA